MMPSESFIDALTVVFLSLCGLLGMLALLSPQRFARFATYSGQWFDTAKVLALLDKRVNIDRFVLRHSRILGALVLASVFVLGSLYLGR